ncbi:rubrerythrin family protein [bacterium]|nr:rubrerythrin family protein [bacterium]
MKLKGTETEKNLLKALTGECLATNKYFYFAKQAKKEGYEQISNIFLETSGNEREHAKLFYKFLSDTTLEINNCYTVTFGSTKENLHNAKEGEHEENTLLYPNFADIAREEGFVEIANTFEHIITVEKHHEARYKRLWENLVNDEIFKKSYETTWKCLKCGYILKDTKAPEVCPSCKHPKAYFEMNSENY